MPDVYVFSSRNLTNVWAGIGARIWAVSKAEGPQSDARRTKAQRMQVGALGVLYCSEIGALTTPFIVFSPPDLEAEVSNIWPETWVLPFRIHPLGSPRRVLPSAEAMQSLPTLAKDGRSNISHILPMQGTTTFVPKQMTSEDWAVLVDRLKE